MVVTDSEALQQGTIRPYLSLTEEWFLATPFGL
jgi:hypothetical protein